MSPRSAMTASAGSAPRSRITCQRIAGSESNSHSMTDLSFPLSRTGFRSRRHTAEAILPSPMAATMAAWSVRARSAYPVANSVIARSNALDLPR